jgi:pSer/pThr/pTyr-binding forkhead associated (FHA) protein
MGVVASCGHMGETRPPGSSERPRPVPALLLSGHEMTLREGETLIGRGANCHVSIVGGLVSRRHAQISNRGGRASVEDLGSRNGVFLNGQRVVAPTVLRDGDTLLIGTTEVTFFLGQPDDAPPPSSRHRFDERGNPLPSMNEDDDDWGPTTEVRIERLAVPEFDREDITAVGTRPPAPGSSAAPRPRAPIPTQRSMPGPERRDPLARELELDLPTPPSGALRRAPTKPASAPAPRPPRTSTLPSGIALGRIGSSAPPRNREQAASDAYSAVLDVVSRMMARGDVDAATRTLATHATRKLEAVREGASLEPALLHLTGRLCLDLAAVTLDPAWVDAAIDLYGVCRVIMAPDVVERVERQLRTMPKPSLARLGNYQGVVRDLLPGAAAGELETAQRILALTVGGE